MRTPYANDNGQALLDCELRAFERRQRALVAVTATCGAPPSRAARDEFRAADAEWRAARAEGERVVDDIIRAG